VNERQAVISAFQINSETEKNEVYSCDFQPVAVPVATVPVSVPVPVLTRTPAPAPLPIPLAAPTVAPVVNTSDAAWEEERVKCLSAVNEYIKNAIPSTGTWVHYLQLTDQASILDVTAEITTLRNSLGTKINPLEVKRCISSFENAKKLIARLQTEATAAMLGWEAKRLEYTTTIEDYKTTMTPHLNTLVPNLSDKEEARLKAAWADIEQLRGWLVTAPFNEAQRAKEAMETAFKERVKTMETLQATAATSKRERSATGSSAVEEFTTNMEFSNLSEAEQGVVRQLPASIVDKTTMDTAMSSLAIYRCRAKIYPLLDRARALLDGISQHRVGKVMTALVAAVETIVSGWTAEFAAITAENAEAMVENITTSIADVEVKCKYITEVALQRDTDLSEVQEIIEQRGTVDDKHLSRAEFLKLGSNVDKINSIQLQLMKNFDPSKGAIIITARKCKTVFQSLAIHSRLKQLRNTVEKSLDDVSKLGTKLELDAIAATLMQMDVIIETVTPDTVSVRGAAAEGAVTEYARQVTVSSEKIKTVAIAYFRELSGESGRDKLTAHTDSKDILGAIRTAAAVVVQKLETEVFSMEDGALSALGMDGASRFQHSIPAIDANVLAVNELGNILSRISEAALPDIKKCVTDAQVLCKSAQNFTTEALRELDTEYAKLKTAYATLGDGIKLPSLIQPAASFGTSTTTGERLKHTMVDAIAYINDARQKIEEGEQTKAAAKVAPKEDAVVVAVAVDTDTDTGTDADEDDDENVDTLLKRLKELKDRASDRSLPELYVDFIKKYVESMPRLLPSLTADAVVRNAYFNLVDETAMMKEILARIKALKPRRPRVTLDSTFVELQENLMRLSALWKAAHVTTEIAGKILALQNLVRPGNFGKRRMLRTYEPRKKGPGQTPTTVSHLTAALKVPDLSAGDYLDTYTRSMPVILDTIYATIYPDTVDRTETKRGLEDEQIMAYYNFAVEVRDYVRSKGWETADSYTEMQLKLSEMRETRRGVVMNGKTRKRINNEEKAFIVEWLVKRNAQDLEEVGGAGRAGRAKRDSRQSSGGRKSVGVRRKSRFAEPVATEKRRPPPIRRFL
jgi:hypothetical protein